MTDENISNDIETGKVETAPIETEVTINGSSGGTTLPATLSLKTKPYKAYANAAASFLALFAMAWVTDADPFTAKEAVTAVVAAAGASGLLGGLVYAVRNPSKK